MKKIKLKTSHSIVFTLCSCSYQYFRAISRAAQILWAEYWIKYQMFLTNSVFTNRANLAIFFDSLNTRIKASAINLFYWGIGVLHY